MRILELLGVQKEYIATISAEDAYDTVSEAATIGKELGKIGISKIIVTTSKFHIRRAEHIGKMHSQINLKFILLRFKMILMNPTVGGKIKDKSDGYSRNMVPGCIIF